MKIIQRRERKESTTYSLAFNYHGHDGWGFAFPCDKDGTIIAAEMGEAGWGNLWKCLFGIHNVVYAGVEKYESSWVEPAVGTCDCGEKVYLTGFTNTCDCGADYNLSGDRLAPRSQWGWDTGESVSDILMADSDYEDADWG